ncbi:MAG: tetratricopeptide repeat protein, partial [Bacteroidota bacterium]
MNILISLILKYICSIHTLRHYFILLCLALVLNIQSFGQQNNYIDSLVNLAKKCTIDTQKVDLLNEISIAWQSENIEKAIESAKEAWSVSKRIDFERGLGESSLNLGKGFEMISDYKKAQDHFENAIKSFEKTGNTWGIGESEKHIGFLFEYQGQYDKALNHYLSALEKMEEAEDIQGIASCLNCLGGIFYFQNDFDNALTYFLRTLEKTKEIGNKFATATTLNNIGLAYIGMSESIEIDSITRNSFLDKALPNIQQALALNKEIGHNYNIAQNLTNIGKIYVNKENYKDAIDALFEALKIQEDLGDQKEISRTLANIGFSYYRISNYSEALLYLFKSLKLSREIGNKEGIKYAFDVISEVYYAKGDYKSAYNNFREYSQCKDSLV